LIENSVVDLDPKPQKDGFDLCRIEPKMIWQILLAASAAPTYFPPYKFSPPDKENATSVFYIDGGIRANNPSRIALTEILTEIESSSLALPATSTSIKEKENNRNADNQSNFHNGNGVNTGHAENGNGYTKSLSDESEWTERRHIDLMLSIGCSKLDSWRIDPKENENLNKVGDLSNLRGVVRALKGVLLLPIKCIGYVIGIHI